MVIFFLFLLYYFCSFCVKCIPNKKFKFKKKIISEQIKIVTIKKENQNENKVNVQNETNEDFGRRQFGFNYKPTNCCDQLKI